MMMMTTTRRGPRQRVTKFDQRLTPAGTHRREKWN